MAVGLILVFLLLDILIWCGHCIGCLFFSPMEWLGPKSAYLNHTYQARAELRSQSAERETPPCYLPCWFEHAHRDFFQDRIHSSTTVYLYNKQVSHVMFWVWLVTNFRIYITFEAPRRLRFFQVLKFDTFIVKICKMSLIYSSSLLLHVKHYNNDIQTAFNLLGAIIELEEKSNS